MSRTKIEIVQFWIWGILLLAMWGVSIWRLRPQEEPLFLHYNVYFGVDWVGAWYLGYLIPVSGVVVVSLNLLFLRQIRKKNLTMAHIIVIWTSLVLALLMVGQFIVLLLNGNS